MHYDHDHRDQDMRSVWRFIMIGACIGFGFLFFKIIVLKFGHSAESMKHHHGVEELYNNGTAQFGPTLILVSLDGFRNDYLQRGVTPHLDKLGTIRRPLSFFGLPCCVSCMHVLFISYPCSCQRYQCRVHEALISRKLYYQPPPSMDYVYLLLIDILILF